MIAAHNLKSTDLARSLSALDVTSFSPCHRIDQCQYIPSEILDEMLGRSKGLQRALAKDGPLGCTELISSINPVSDYQGNFDIANPGGIRKRLLPQALLHAMNSDAESPEVFAEKFLSAETPAEVYLKPDGSAGGNGVVKLARTDSSISISTRDPDGRYLPSQQGLLQFAEENRGISIERDSAHRMLSLIIPLHDPARAVRFVAECCRAALTTRFDHTPGTPGFPYMDLNSGLVERAHDLMKIDGRVIEGRYYLVYRQGHIMMSGEPCPDGTLSPSFMKRGLDGIFVNGGERLAYWPDMHHCIVEKGQLSCTGEQMNVAMQSLLYQQAGQTLVNLSHLFPSPAGFFQGLEAAGLIVDVAWESSRMLRYETSEMTEPIWIPEPVLIEMDLRLRLQG